jgi:hypothetical protein
MTLLVMTSVCLTEAELPKKVSTRMPLALALLSVFESTVRVWLRLAPTPLMVVLT